MATDQKIYDRLAKEMWDGKPLNELDKFGALCAILDLLDVIEDKRRLTRELDVAMHGEEGAAEQASLCDLLGPVRKLRGEIEQLCNHIKALKHRADAEGLYLGMGFESKLGNNQEGPMVKKLYKLAGVKGY